MMVGETPVPVGEKETDLRLRFCEAPDSKDADEMSESHIHSRFPRAHGVHGWFRFGNLPAHTPNVERRVAPVVRVDVPAEPVEGTDDDHHDPGKRKQRAHTCSIAPGETGCPQSGTSADRGFAAVGTTRCARSARVSYEGSRAPRARRRGLGARGGSRAEV